MGRIGKDLEGSCLSVIEEKCRSLVDDKKEIQGRKLRNQDTKREPPVRSCFAWSTLLGVILFGGGGDGDEVNSSVSCRRYHISCTVMYVFLYTWYFHFRLLYRKVITVYRLVSTNTSYVKIYYETWLHVIPKLFHKVHISSWKSVLSFPLRKVWSWDKKQPIKSTVSFT